MVRNLTKQWAYPKGLKRFIYESTDFQTNTTLRTNRFVEYIEMFEGKPLKRIFGFVSKTKNRSYKDILVKEVARYYDHCQYLGGVECCYLNGQKKCWFGYKDRFTKYNKHQWWFDCYEMTDYDQFLQDNNLLYTGWNDYKGYLSFDEYITDYLKNPKIELLVKAGLSKWVRYLRYLDTSKKAIHDVFKIHQDCVPLLYEYGFGFQELLMCRKTHSNDLQYLRNKVALKYRLIDLRRWYGGNDENVIQVLKQEKTIKYIIDKKIWERDYIDYLRDLAQLGAITDAKALYPKNFMKAHNEANKQIEISKSKELIDGFIKAYKKHKKYIYEDSDFIIKPVKEPMELYEESAKLNHCVRTYDKDVSKGETEILFIRKLKSQNKPFYTLELKRKKIVQVRGKGNKNPDKKVDAFVQKWANEYKFKYEGNKDWYY